MLARPEHLPPGGTPEDALRFLRYLASQARLQEIHFLWRPFLADADDDLVLELAKPLESARYARAFGDEARLLQARRTTLSMALAAPAAIYTPSWTIAGAGG